MPIRKTHNAVRSHALAKHDWHFHYFKDQTLLNKVWATMVLS